MEVDEDDDDEEEDEDELDGLVVDEGKRFVGKMSLDTKTFGEVGGETGAERAPGLVGLIGFLSVFFFFLLFFSGVVARNSESDM